MDARQGLDQSGDVQRLQLGGVPVVCNASCMCELLVGLGAGVVILSVADLGVGLEVTVETSSMVPGCDGCGQRADLKDRHDVRHVDLPLFGRLVVLVWRKWRWRCLNTDCDYRSWTERCDVIAGPRQLMTARAGRWATVQVGKKGRAVQDMADELGCDWHTVNDTVVAFGDALIDADTGRVGDVEALGLDETLFQRQSRWRRQCWATSIVDVETGQLLDMVLDRSAVAVARPKTKAMACRDPVWGVGSVRPVPQSVRHDPARCCAGSGPVPCH